MPKNIQPVSANDVARLLDAEYQQSVRSSGRRWDDPNYLAELEAQNRRRESAKLDLRTASTISPVERKWLFPNLFPQGELIVVAGSPAVGKTTFIAAIAAAITRGRDGSLHADLEPAGAGHVIIINREDDEASGLITRLKVAGADLERVHFIGENIGPGDETPFSLSNARDLNRLVGLSEKLNHNIGLVVVDPIYLAVDGDHNSDPKTRAACQTLTKLAKHLGCAIIGVAHALRNTKGKSALDRIAGPGALRQVPRQIIFLSKIAPGRAEWGGTHVIVQAKNSEGSLSGGFEYQIANAPLESPSGVIYVPKFVITKRLIESTEEILARADGKDAAVKVKRSDAAIQFLRSTLLDGPRLWIEIEEMAKDANIKKATLMLAKKTLNVRTQKVSGNGGRSLWRLPEVGEKSG